MAQIRKALAAAIAAGAAAFATATQDPSMTGNARIAFVVGSAIVAGFLVFFVPNAPTPPALPGGTPAK